MRRMFSVESILNIIDNEISKLFEADDKKYKFVACVLRCVNGHWQQIDGQHAPINVESVEQDGASIIVNYKFTCKNVVSFIACPDETFSALNYTMGASGQLSRAVINVFRNVNYSGYIAWDGASFNVMNDITSASFDGDTGELTINHSASQNALGRSLVVRGGKYLAYLKSASSTSDVVVLTDYDGVPITTLDTDVKLYWGANGRITITPSDANTEGNIWCLGIMEV